MRAPPGSALPVPPLLALYWAAVLHSVAWPGPGPWASRVQRPQRRIGLSHEPSVGRTPHHPRHLGPFPRPFMSPGPPSPDSLLSSGSFWVSLGICVSCPLLFVDTHTHTHTRSLSHPAARLCFASGPSHGVLFATLCPTALKPTPTTHTALPRPGQRLVLHSLFGTLRQRLT